MAKKATEAVSVSTSKAGAGETLRNLRIDVLKGGFVGVCEYEQRNKGNSPMVSGWREERFALSSVEDVVEFVTKELRGKG